MSPTIRLRRGSLRPETPPNPDPFTLRQLEPSATYTPIPDNPGEDENTDNRGVLPPAIFRRSPHHGRTTYAPLTPLRRTMIQRQREAFFGLFKSEELAQRLIENIRGSNSTKGRDAIVGSQRAELPSNRARKASKAKGKREGTPAAFLESDQRGSLVYEVCSSRKRDRSPNAETSIGPRLRKRAKKVTAEGVEHEGTYLGDVSVSETTSRTQQQPDDMLEWMISAMKEEDEQAAAEQVLLNFVDAGICVAGLSTRPSQHLDSQLSMGPPPRPVRGIKRRKDEELLIAEPIIAWDVVNYRRLH